MKRELKIRKQILKNYSEVALNASASGCCNAGCSCNGSVIDVKESSVKIGYSFEEILNVPLDSNMGLGCGNPLSIASLKKGEIVLDLGSGGGFDCFLASKQVGDTGHVIGVDMTPDMVELARKDAEYNGYSNVEFRLGEIENLPVADESVNVVISNCVINLSLDKARVFKEVYRVLKTGGRLSISDVVATAELPDEIKQDLRMLTGCIAGAEFVDNLKEMMNEAGFKDIKLTPKDNGREIVKSWVPDKNIQDYVSSYIIEAVK